MTVKDGRATLAVVAASAGVSVATVSKVLNGRSDVAPATRDLVQKMLEQYDYLGRPADTVRRAVPTTRPTVELVYAGQLNAYSTEIGRSEPAHAPSHSWASQMRLPTARQSSTASFARA